MRVGKKAIEWEKAKKKLKKEFEEKGITQCEICGSDYIMSFHHRNKRRFNDPHTFENVILLCVHHHHELEYNKDLSKKWFDELRPIRA